MGNSESSTKGGGGGVFQCCTASADFDEPTTTILPSKRLIMLNARSMHGDAYDSNDDEKMKY